MDRGNAGGEPAFSAEKTRAGVRRKETGIEENNGHSFFSKNFIEVWLIFSVALSSAAQECDSVIHIQKYIFFFLFFFVWFMTGYLMYILMLFSRTLLFIIPLYRQLPVFPSPTPFLMATSCLGLFWLWMNSHIPCLGENPLILTKRGK